MGYLFVIVIDDNGNLIGGYSIATRHNEVANRAREIFNIETLDQVVELIGLIGHADT